MGRAASWCEAKGVPGAGLRPSDKGAGAPQPPTTPPTMAPTGADDGDGEGGVVDGVTELAGAGGTVSPASSAVRPHEVEEPVLMDWNG